MFTTDFYPVPCCDMCGDFIGVHFDCPVCRVEDASTTMYDDFYMVKGQTFECENCKTEFEIVGLSGLSIWHDVLIRKKNRAVDLFE